MNEADFVWHKGEMDKAWKFHEVEMAKWRIFCQEQAREAHRHAWLMYFIGFATPVLFAVCYYYFTS